MTTPIQQRLIDEMTFALTLGEAVNDTPSMTYAAKVLTESELKTPSGADDWSYWSVSNNKHRVFGSGRPTDEVLAKLRAAVNALSA